MGLALVSAIVVGTMIGASIFVQPTEIARQVPSVGGTLLVWLAAGILTMCGALVCAELTAAFPQSGGVYVFLREGISPLAAFLWGWSMFWSAHTGIISASAVVLARYVAYFAPMGEAGIRATACVAILLVSAVNYAGVKQGGRLQSTVTFAKLAAIVILLVLAAFLGETGACLARRAVCNAGVLLAADGSRDRCGTVRLRRMAPSDIHRGGNARSRAHYPDGALFRHADRHGVLLCAELRVLLSAASGQSDRLDARGRRRRRSDLCWRWGHARGNGGVAAGAGVIGGRVERSDPGGSARVPPDVA